MVAGDFVETLVPYVVQTDRQRLRNILNRSIQEIGTRFAIEVRIRNQEDKASWVAIRGKSFENRNTLTRWVTGSILDLSAMNEVKEIFEKADKPLVFRFDDSKYKLCAVGRLCHQKGFDILLDIYARAAELRQDLHLYIIGDGPDREALRLKARDMEIDRRMTFLGNQPNPYAYMSHMDGLAITSRYEGQGMVIMEAKALGLDLYVARNLEGCNQGIRCSDDIAGELLTADKREKQRDDLSAYNRNITRQLNRIFGIR
jgi:glycosyltransferase involved in cell wall biosynthesis